MKKTNYNQLYLYGGLALLVIVVAGVSLYAQGGLFKGMLSLPISSTTITTTTTTTPISNNIQAPSTTFSTGSGQTPVTAKTALALDPCVGHDPGVICSLNSPNTGAVITPKVGDNFNVILTICDNQNKIMKAENGQIKANTTALAIFPDVYTIPYGGTGSGYMPLMTNQTGPVTYTGTLRSKTLGETFPPVSVTCGTITAVTTSQPASTGTNYSASMPLPTAPANLKAVTYSNLYASIYWDTVNDATSYNIYKNGLYLNKVVNNHSYIDFNITAADKGSSIQYQVAAVNSTGEGARSSVSYLVPGTAAIGVPLAANSCKAFINNVELANNATVTIPANLQWKVTLNRIPTSTEQVKILDNAQHVMQNTGTTTTLSYTSTITDAKSYNPSVVINGATSSIICPSFIAKQ